MGRIDRRTTTEMQIKASAETHYASATLIDRHNRCRQNDLELEKHLNGKE